MSLTCSKSLFMLITPYLVLTICDSSFNAFKKYIVVRKPKHAHPGHNTYENDMFCPLAVQTPEAAREHIAESSRWGNFGKCWLWKFLTEKHLQQLLENTFLRETSKLKHARSKHDLLEEWFWRRSMRYTEESREEPSFWGELPKPTRKQTNLWYGNICAPGTYKAQNIWRNMTQGGV